MTIQEAIEILESPKFGTIWPTPRREKDAVQLSIKALRRCQTLSNHPLFKELEPLPGETEE